MDRKKLDELITENMRTVLGFALTRLGNVHEAEELASDIIYRLLRSAENIRDDGRFYAYMRRVAENAYVDRMRGKRRQTAELSEAEDVPDGDVGPQSALVRREELGLLRRELAMLAERYRRATVMYYVDGMSCARIAAEMNVSTETVKYLLFRARKLIREGMNMERLYGERSYRPDAFEIDFWGENGGNDEEYREFRRRKLKGNNLLAAYYGAVAPDELGVELGVSLPYLEDELRLLTERGYLVRRGGKYLTNIPIFTADCTEAADRAFGTLVKDAAARYAALHDGLAERFGERFESASQRGWQRLLLCLHFALIESSTVRAERYGQLPENGVYSKLCGGRGIVWGRSARDSEHSSCRIYGIYNDGPLGDGIIAMNFAQTLDVQHYQSDMFGAISAAAESIDGLSSGQLEMLERLGYVGGGRTHFPVWTESEYNELRELLADGISVLSECLIACSERAAGISADLAPEHIRAEAEFAGANVYGFVAAERLTDALFEIGALDTEHLTGIPALCAVTK